MKRIRDVLIVVVLGGIVIWFVVRFVSNIHDSFVALSPIVGRAEVACIEDGMLCHVGRSTFESEADAQAYLDSPEHQAKEKERAVKAEEDRQGQELQKQAAEMAKQGVSVVKAACRKDRTLNCALINKENAESFAEMILKSSRSKAKSDQ